MSEPFLGEIRMFTGPFAPRGWALCNGQLLSIAQNNALFAIIGIQYGGDGQTTFALPNLQGRVPVHAGTLAGGGTYVMGEAGGSENVTLLQTQMPAHTHPVLGGPQAAAVEADQPSPIGNIPAQTNDGNGTDYPSYTSPSKATGNLGGSGVNIGISGGSQPHSNLQPFLIVNFIIALQGIFPTRN